MKKFIYLLSSVVLLFISCDNDFEELNVAPNKPVTADLRAVYNQVSASYRNIGTEQTFLRNELLLPGTQLAGLSRKIGVDPVVRSRDGLWNNYYNALKNITFLESEIAKEEHLNTVNAEALLKIAKAFLTLKTTDLFGDMPYSEAGRGFFTGDEQILRPVYDDSKSIYLQSLEDLKWANENIVENPDDTFLNFTSMDSYFGGNLLKWRKLANTLRLRYALRMSENDPAAAANIISDVMGSNQPLIEGVSNTSEDFVYNRIAAGDTGWLVGAFRAAGSNGVRMGETIWNYMSDSDDVNGSGIYDPRIYVYFEPNKDDLWIPVSQDFDSGITPTDDGDIYHGSRRLSYDNGRHTNHYSAVNTRFIYSRTNRVPIVTSSEAYFLKAEIYARGLGVAADESLAEENYLNGIKASVNYWYTVVANDLDATEWSKYPLAVNIPPTTAEMDAFLTHPNVQLTGTADEKLDKIYGQRWISLFWLTEEAHFLQARTQRTPLTGARGDFYRLPYPDSEEANNKANFDAAVANMGGNSSSLKLWWMK